MVVAVAVDRPIGSFIYKKLAQLCLFRRSPTPAPVPLPTPLLWGAGAQTFYLILQIAFIRFRLFAFCALILRLGFCCCFVALTLRCLCYVSAIVVAVAVVVISSVYLAAVPFASPLLLLPAPIYC